MDSSRHKGVVQGVAVSTTRHGQSSRSGAVIRPVAGDDLVTMVVASYAVVLAGRLDGGLGGLRAGTGEERVSKVTGRRRGEPLGQFHRPRVVKKIGPAVATLRACSAIAAVMSARPCPRGLCHIDEQRSK